MDFGNNFNDSEPTTSHSSIPPDHVQLNIRTPIDPHEEFKLTFSLSSLVRGLKQELESIHPCRPPPQAQRLIYGGKVLQDDTPLKDILKRGDSHTIHLVIRVDENTTIKTKVNPFQQGESTSSIRQRHINQDAGSATNSESELNTSTQADDFRSSNSVPILDRTISTLGTNIFFQCVFINGAPYLVPVVNPLFPVEGLPMMAPFQPFPSLHPQVPQSSGASRAAHRNLLARHPRRRYRITINLVPHLYLIFKLFFAILIFSNGTMSRLLVLYSIAIIIFLFQSGFVAEVRRRLFPPANIQRPVTSPTPNPAPNSPESQEQAAHADQSNTPSSSSTTPVSNNSPPPAPPASRLQLIKSFVVGFVTSLIPGYDEVEGQGPQQPVDMVA